MNELLKRGFFGSIYVVIMWFGTAYSERTFQILFLVLGLWSIYEMWKLRKGKPKLVALIMVIIPFFTIQLFGMTDSNYPEMPFNPSLVLLMYILTWTFDSFAYLTGRKLGKTKILPLISPKKSWEGFFGGVAAALIGAYILSHYFTILSNKHWIVLGAIISLTAVLGDLIESMFKRSVGVKDSGTLLPGHGGILDRFDSVLFVIPFVYLYLQFFA